MQSTTTLWRGFLGKVLHARANLSSNNQIVSHGWFFLRLSTWHNTTIQATLSFELSNEWFLDYVVPLIHVSANGAH